MIIHAFCFEVIFSSRWSGIYLAMFRLCVFVARQKLLWLPPRRGWRGVGFQLFPKLWFCFTPHTNSSKRREYVFRILVGSYKQRCHQITLEFHRCCSRGAALLLLLADFVGVVRSNTCNTVVIFYGRCLNKTKQKQETLNINKSVIHSHEWRLSRPYHKSKQWLEIKS